MLLRMAFAAARKMCARQAQLATECDTYIVQVPERHRPLILQYGRQMLISSFFFDDDVRVSTGIIETYVEAAQRYGPGHFFGGPLLIDAEAPCPAHLVPYLPPSATGWAFANRETEIKASE